MTRKTKRSTARKPAAVRAGGKVAEQIEQPTPEQARRVEYERRPVRTEMGATIGVSYRRKPLFETMAEKPGNIAANELAALRYYRSAFDRSARSPTKSCLDIGAGGGGGRGVPAELANATASMIDAKRRVRACEEVIGATLVTMRGVVLDDRSFTELAIERFGSREQDWIVDGKSTTKIVPRSGRHREIIRQEFLDGLRLLTRRLATLTNMQGTVEMWVELRADGGATIELALSAPSRRYRLWGAYREASVVREKIRERFSRDHIFRSPEEAREALDEANEALRRPMLCLEDDELAR